MLEHREHERLYDLDESEWSSPRRASEGLPDECRAFRRNLSTEKGMQTFGRVELEEYNDRTLWGGRISGKTERFRFANCVNLSHGKQEGARLLGDGLHRKNEPSDASEQSADRRGGRSLRMISHIASASCHMYQCHSHDERPKAAKSIDPSPSLVKKARQNAEY